MDDKGSNYTLPWRAIAEWIAALVAAAIIAVLVQRYAYAQLIVHNISMQKTLYDGQRLIEDRWTYHFHEPRRGDIVIINGPEADVRLIKRVIALPGDQLDIKDGIVWLNGDPLPEPYANGKTEPNDMTLPYTVGDNQLFVMGDNREYSLDSRLIGPIAISSIEGKAVFRIYPLHLFGKLN